jgi:tetratricopeptide (TPR) repeat protein
MTSEELIKYIEKPDLMNLEILGKLETLIVRYPYFSTARILYMKCLHRTKPAAYEKKLSAHFVYVPSRWSFITYIKNQLPRPSLSVFDIKQSETAQPKPVVEEKTDHNEQGQDILSEIVAGRNPKPETVQEKPEKPIKTTIVEENRSDGDDFFSETLANIYLKKGKYEKAMKIFKKLILQYPEKSAYFADQIRKCEFLIAN